MHLAPIEGKNCYGRVRLIMLSSGALVLVVAGKEGGPVVSAVIEDDDIDFLLDYLLMFIGESHRRRAYLAWKIENGFVDQQGGRRL